MATWKRPKCALFVPLLLASTEFRKILRKHRNSMATGKFRGSAQNSACRGKLWSLHMIGFGDRCKNYMIIECSWMVVACPLIIRLCIQSLCLLMCNSWSNWVTKVQRQGYMERSHGSAFPSAWICTWYQWWYCSKDAWSHWHLWSPTWIVCLIYL